MTELTLTHANMLQQALTDKDGLAKYRTSQLTAEFVEVLEKHGLKVIGHEAKPGDPEDKKFWTVFNLESRIKAVQAIKPFTQPDAPIAFKLTPIEVGEYHYGAHYACPTCGSKAIRWTDGDSIGVAVLPQGIGHYDDIDTSLMVGTCEGCQEPLYFYELGFTTVTDPCADGMFVVTNIVANPDRVECFKAEDEAGAIQPWVVSRISYVTGKKVDGGFVSLPKGPFMVDYHQFGPFKLERDGELSGPYGVARCGNGGANDKWAVGSRLLHNLAANAMQAVKQAANDLRTGIGPECQERLNDAFSRYMILNGIYHHEDEGISLAQAEDDKARFAHLIQLDKDGRPSVNGERFAQFAEGLYGIDHAVAIAWDERLFIETHGFTLGECPPVV